MYDHLACFFVKRFGCKVVANTVELSAPHAINYLINDPFKKTISNRVIHLQYLPLGFIGVLQLQNNGAGFIDYQE